MLEKFLLSKAHSSIRFAHLLFWYIIAGLDDSESIQLSQYKRPQVWTFLRTLIDTVERSEKISQTLEKSAEKSSSPLEEEFKTQEGEKLFKNTIKIPKLRQDDLVTADTGSSIIRYDYTQFN